MLFKPVKVTSEKQLNDIKALVARSQGNVVSRSTQTNQLMRLLLPMN